MKTVVEYLLSPFSIALLFLLFGNVFLFFKKYLRTGRIFCAIAFFVMLISSIGIITDRLLNYLEFQYVPFQMEDTIKYDTVVVLSGWAEKNPNLSQTSQLSTSSLARLCEAVRIYRENKKIEIHIVGGGPLSDYQGMSLSEIIADVAVSLGIPKNQIVCEKKSRNTYENAYYLKDKLKDKQFILVTSALHMPRAVAVFKTLGMNPVPAPTDYKSVYGNSIRNSIHYRVSVWQYYSEMYLPRIKNLEYLTLALREYLSLLWYKLKGYTV